MAELLPEAWRMDDLLVQTDHPGTSSNKPSPRKKPVTDILSWVECFAIMAAIITCKKPEKAPGLFAYSKSIVRVSQVFEGPAWVSYDIQYRRKAALSRSWDWGTIDTALYNETFTGRAKSRPLCRVCFVEDHFEKACPLRLTTMESDGRVHQVGNTSGGIGPTSHYRSGQRYGVNCPNHRSVELCGVFNRGECRFKDCKYAHVSLIFRGRSCFDCFNFLRYRVNALILYPKYVTDETKN